MSDRISEIVDEIKPYVYKWINNSLGVGGGVSSQNTGAGTYAPTPHTHSGIHHSGTLPHNSSYLSDLTSDTHTIYASADGAGTRSAYQAERLNKSITSGSGLSGGGLLTSSQELRLVAPGTLSVSSTNNAASSHTHAITSSSNPGLNSSILSTDSSGLLALQQLNIENTSGCWFKFKTDAVGALRVSSGSVSQANLVLEPYADIILGPGGDDILPDHGYEKNLGSLQKKYLTLYAAELWVETLVAQETIATIGGRILVGPTTEYTRDLSASTNEPLQNPGFEASGTGGFSDWIEVPSNGAVERDNTVFLEGGVSCKMIGGITADTGVYQTVDVEEQEAYDLLFYTRAGATGESLFYRVVNESASSNIIGFTDSGTSACTWESVSASFLAPTSCSQITLEFIVDTDDTAWVDDVLLYGSASVYTKHNEMATGDIAYSEANGKVEFFEVLSSADEQGEGDYLYTVRRNLDGSGRNDWFAGDALFNTGATGQGFIDLYSVHGIKAPTELGPTIVGNIRESSTYNDWNEGWAIGNLDGIYGYGTTTFGIGLGEYQVSSYMTIDPTNGIRFHRSNGNIVGKWEAGGDFILGEVATDNANLFWDQSEGRLNFRGGTNGTQVGAYIDTDGSIAAGGGDVLINSDGIRMNALAGKNSTASIEWYNGATREFSVGTVESGGSVNNSYIESRLDLVITATSTGADIFLEPNISGGAVAVLNGPLVTTNSYIESADDIRTVGGDFIANQGSYKGDAVSIDDDNATSFTPGNTSGVLLLSNAGGGGGAAINVLITFRVGASPFCVIMTQSGTTVEVTTGALAGTTGTDTKFTVSTHTDGKIYLENRTGGTVAIKYVLFNS